VVGLPTQMARSVQRFGFTAIADARWRLVAKELILAMLAPRHDAVAPLPRAYRTPLHLNTAGGRLAELIRWFACIAIAHNLTRAAATLAGRPHHTARAATIRRHLTNIAGRITRPAREITIHLPQHWP
jgi:hypothetical protein